jgi:hypothetical protein
MKSRNQSQVLVATMVILLSFCAGIGFASGIRSILVARAEYHWAWELAMAFFLLLTAVSYAQRLIGRPDANAGVRSE